MRKPDPSRGFFLCFLTNLALHFWWGVAALLLLILHFWLDIHWGFAWAASAIWGMEALVLTLLISWGNGCSRPTPEKKNQNPYSAKNKDLFPTEQGEDKP